MSMSEHAKDYWPVYGIFAVLAILAAILIPLAIKDQNRWETWCVGQGGHVTDHTSTTVTTTVAGNGQVGTGVGSETTYYCLSADGRILDIQ